MIHHYIESADSGDHWAVASQAQVPVPDAGRVLVQVQKDGVQARISLTPEQAIEMATQMLEEAERAKAVGNQRTAGHIQYIGATREGMSQNLTVAFSHDALTQHMNRLGFSGPVKKSQ